MKYLIPINRYFRFLLMFGLFQSICYAQVSNKHYLSNDIENLINSNPNQALKIAQYLLSKTNTSNTDKSQINFLISQAYMVKGDYSGALDFLYEVQNYEEYLTKEQKINIDISKIIILRDLTLKKQSKKILEKLENTTVSDANLKMYLDVVIAIEKSKFLLKENKNIEGINLLKKQEININEITKKYKNIDVKYLEALGELFLKNNNLDQAQILFEKANNKLNSQNEENAFSKCTVLYGLAKINFIKKEYNEANVLCKEAMTYVERFENVFLNLKINQLQSKIYLALNDMVNYKLINSKFFELQATAEDQDQEAINSSYNLISEEYDNSYSIEKSKYIDIVYIISGIFLLLIFIGLFFWQKIYVHKKRLNEIINYIEITRSNIMSSFSIIDKNTDKNPDKNEKNDTKKHVILKETEEQILSKLKKFETSKRFIKNDISLAVLAGQLDSNTKYLSEIINTHYDVNFNTYINKLRVNYIIEKLKSDPNFINYKISYLAENCGFSSHSSFATVFKSITGLSPVKFIELLNQEKEKNLLE